MYSRGPTHRARIVFILQKEFSGALGADTQCGFSALTTWPQHIGPGAPGH